MGVVYQARQLSLNRLVALKMIRSAHLAGETDVDRFQAEAEAAGGLDHPNIVPIYEVGERDGQHFFSMKLVEGGSLAQQMGRFHADPRAAARLLVKIARAVHYAHQCGVLHRDLKPANILLDRLGEPQVIDFGLAKRVEADSSITLSGSVLGTPHYMAPEQAAGQTRRLTTASDIYSLGAILYQLLTGKLPFDAPTPLEVIRMVVDHEPLPPSSFGLRLDLDLETISLKCLEKEPQNRYRSAAELADDLDRWLNHLPILARPASRWEHTRKWVRRRPAIASLLAVCLLAATTIFSLTLVNRARLQRERDNAIAKEALATRERDRAEKTLEQLGIQVSEERFSLNEPGDGLAKLASLLREHPDDYVAANRLFYAMEQMPFELPALEIHSEVTAAPHATYSHDGLRLAVQSTGNAVSIRDSLTGKAISETMGNPGTELLDGVFSRNDRTFVVTGLRGLIRSWDLTTGQPSGVTFNSGTNGYPVVRALYADRDRRLITVSRGGGVSIWDTATGDKLAGPLASTDKVVDVGMSPDGQHFVTASFDSTARIWEVETAREMGAVMRHEGPVLSAAFSPDGLRIVTASMDNTARLWNGRTGAPLTAPLRHYDYQPPLGAGTNWGWLKTARVQPFDYVWDYKLYLMIPQPLAHGGSVLYARLSPDGQRIVTACFDGTVWVWDATTGQPLFEPIRHRERVQIAEFSPEGQRILTASYDATARVWDSLTGQPLAGPLRHPLLVSEACFAPDGLRVMTTGGSEQNVRVWETGTGNALPLRLRHRDSLTAASFSRDGRMAATASHDRTARVWDAQTGRALTVPLAHQSAVLTTAFSPSGAYLVTGTSGGEMAAWSVAEGSCRWHVQAANDLQGMVFNEDGTRLAVFGQWGARVWDPATGQPLSPVCVHVAGERLPWACLNREGSRLATAGWAGTLAIWDTQTGLELGRTARTLGNTHAERINFAEFSPDGKRIVSASSDGTAFVWDARTCKRALPPLRHGDQVQHAAFSPDGSIVATASLDGTARLWSAKTGELLTEPLRHKGWVWAVTFSQDGRRVATASYDRSARVWDVHTGKPLTYPLTHAGEVNGVSFSPDGKRLLTSSLDGSARIFELPEAPTPVPDWFLDVAEVVGGQRINQHGLLEAVSPVNLARVRALALQREGEDFYTKWSKWLFADRATRTLSALSPVSLPEYVETLIDDNSLTALREAVQRSPTNALACARLALCLVEQPDQNGPLTTADAEFLSRRALQLAPNDPEIQRIGARVTERSRQSLLSQ
jgi:eukaryotic-like serine/threonine-protein kinase